MIIFMNIGNTSKIVFLCKSFTFQEPIKMIKTYKYLNKLSKNSCFWVKNMGQGSFRPKLKRKVELLLTTSCPSGLDWLGSVTVSELRALRRCSSILSQRGAKAVPHFQHPQPPNCHCWDPESSQIAMVTYPLMLRGSATAKHWPTDTW